MPYLAGVGVHSHLFPIHNKRAVFSNVVLSATQRCVISETVMVCVCSAQGVALLKVVALL